MNKVMDQYFREMKTFREKTYEVLKAWEAYQAAASSLEACADLYDDFEKKMRELKEIVK